MDKKTLLVSVITASVCLFLILAVVYLTNMQGKNENKTPANVNTVQKTTKKVEVETDSKSFLKDEEFLDEKQPNRNVVMEVKKKTAVLSVNSVAKDLRVTILDRFGKKITNVPFFVKVDGVGEYKDLDMDGYVYIAGLKAGNYDVSLEETQDYLCKDSVNIDVFETVQYEPLSDIELSIVQENDIIIAEEDTRQAEVYKDDTENTDITKSTDIIDFGIDVSSWQQDIDWKKVKEAGVDFAIIRCGYRGAKTGALVEDSHFYKNLTEAKDAGVDVGVYFFTQAINETEAVEEASMVLALVGDTKLDYPIFIDTENTNGRADGIDRETRTAVCDAFCKTIEKSGKSAGIYASRNWFNNKLNDSKLNGHNRWVAEYASTTAYAGSYEMWQYTSSGHIDGIEGRVDLDISYLTD